MAVLDISFTSISFSLQVFSVCTWSWHDLPLLSRHVDRFHQRETDVKVFLVNLRVTACTPIYKVAIFWCDPACFQYPTAFWASLWWSNYYNLKKFYFLQFRIVISQLEHLHNSRNIWKFNLLSLRPLALFVLIATMTACMCMRVKMCRFRSQLLRFPSYRADIHQATRKTLTSIGSRLRYRLLT